MIFKVPYLNYEDVREHAKTFLEKYHPLLQLPIPIEWLHSRPRHSLGWFETHANWFAGQICQGGHKILWSVFYREFADTLRSIPGKSCLSKPVLTCQTCQPQSC